MLASVVSDPKTIMCLYGTIELAGGVALLRCRQCEDGMPFPAGDLMSLLDDCARQPVDAHGWQVLSRTVEGCTVQVTVSDQLRDPRYPAWAEIHVSAAGSRSCSLMLDGFALSELRAG